ncbi:MAG TPA: MFS transporter, partial [Nevskiaceae bacterium]|nr:MFS transporter [Nevskiaceae bacterium]
METARAEWKAYGFLPFVAALGYATSVLQVYSLGPFIAPLQADFGWSRAQVSFGLTVMSIVNAVLCIPVGLLVDRVGPRRVGLFGVLLMAVVVASLGTATGSMLNWALLWSGVALGSACVQATVWTSAINTRFEKSRGLALALTLSGASFAAAVFPLAAAWLIGAHGWRGGYGWMAGLWAACVFPILFLGFRGARDGGRAAKAEAEAAPRVLAGVGIAEGLRSPTLYKMVLAAGLFAFTLLGIVVHFVPILTDAGATRLQAAGTTSLIGIFSIIGRLGTGVLLDRFPAHLVGAGAFLLPIAGVTLLLADGANPASQAIAAATFGLTLGSEVDVFAYLMARHFGLKHFGALY